MSFSNFGYSNGKNHQLVVTLRNIFKHFLMTLRPPKPSFRLLYQSTTQVSCKKSHRNHALITINTLLLSKKSRNIAPPNGGSLNCIVYIHQMLCIACITHWHTLITCTISPDFPFASTTLLPQVPLLRLPPLFLRTVIGCSMVWLSLQLMPLINTCSKQIASQPSQEMI